MGFISWARSSTTGIPRPAQLVITDRSTARTNETNVTTTALTGPPRGTSEAAMIAPRKPSLDALVGIRFLAAMHIVMHHYVIMVPEFRAGAPEWLRRLVAAAPSSVDLFFVLSGFVLAYNYAAA